MAEQPNHEQDAGSSAPDRPAIGRGNDSVSEFALPEAVLYRAIEVIWFTRTDFVAPATRCRRGNGRLTFDAALASEVPHLSEVWHDDHIRTQRIGAEWHNSMKSAVLRVPSAIEPNECNYVINPDHPDYPAVVFGRPEPYVFDPRLN